jgi:hypothetical protein
MAKRDGSLTFNVTGLDGGNYLPGLNHDPDGDSNGSSITITR